MGQGTCVATGSNSNVRRPNSAAGSVGGGHIVTFLHSGHFPSVLGDGSRSSFSPSPSLLGTSRASPACAVQDMYRGRASRTSRRFRRQLPRGLCHDARRHLAARRVVRNGAQRRRLAPLQGDDQRRGLLRWDETSAARQPGRRGRASIRPRRRRTLTTSPRSKGSRLSPTLALFRQDRVRRLRLAFRQSPRPRGGTGARQGRTSPQAPASRTTST